MEAERRRMVLKAAAMQDGWFCDHDVYRTLQTLSDADASRWWASIPGYLRIWWSEGDLARERLWLVRDRGECPERWKHGHAAKMLYRWKE
jgi:hypothetical protein